MKKTLAKRVEEAHAHGKIVNQRTLVKEMHAQYNDILNRWELPDGSCGIFDQNDTREQSMSIEDVPYYNKRMTAWLDAGGYREQPSKLRHVIVNVPKFKEVDPEAEIEGPDVFDAAAVERTGAAVSSKTVTEAEAAKVNQAYEERKQIDTSTGRKARRMTADD